MTTAAPKQARALRVRPATAVLAALLLGTAVILMYAGRHLTFFFDEWDFILGRRGSSLSTYLDPHNGHLSLFGVIFYKLFLQLFGLRHYWPYRAAVVVLDLISGWLLYVLAARRLGPWLALFPAAVLLLLGSAYQDLLWPFQVGFLGSVASGLGALTLLDRPSGRADAFACGLLVYSVGSSGIGIAFLAACFVMLIAQHSERRRFWLIAVPVVLFAIWYVGWGGGEGVTSSSVLGAPQYVANAAAAAFAGILGLDPSGYGPALTVAGVAALALLAHRRAAVSRPLLLAALAGALVFWGLSAVARATEADPQASRYVYIGAVFVLLVVVEVCAGMRLPRAGIALLCVLTAGVLVANLDQLRTGEQGMRAADDSVRASLAAVDIAAPVVPAAFYVNEQSAPQILAGPYLAAVHDFGTPALTLAEIERAPASTRAAIDQTIEHAENIVPVAAAPRCSPGVAPGPITVAPGHQLVIVSLDKPAAVYVRRFSPSNAPAPLATLVPHQFSVLRFPADLAPSVPWTVQARGATMCVS